MVTQSSDNPRWSVARRTAAKVPPLGRYLMVGGLVGLTYVALTLLFAGVVGMPIEIAIAIAYLVAVVIHFLGQRVFVFAHVETFELSTRRQVLRYIVLGGTQYVVTAGAT